MHPILFHIGPLQFYSYGLFMAFSVLAAIKVVGAESTRCGWNKDKMTRLVVYNFIAAMIGSRLVFVLTRLSDPNVSFLNLLFNPRAGFVYYGGVIGSWSYLTWYIKRYKLPQWPVTDAFALALSAGMIFGRTGCLLGGCCFGKPTTLPWGVVMQPEALLGALHPVQAYEALSMTVLFSILWFKRSRKNYEGQILVWFLGTYSILRYFLEFFRGDKIRGFLIEDYLSTSQFISIPMFALALYLRFSLKRRNSGRPSTF